MLMVVYLVETSAARRTCRPNDQRHAAAGIHMVGAVLRVVLDDEDQRRSPRPRRARIPLDNQAEGKIIVRHLRLDRVHAIDRFVEVTEMVVAEA